MKPSFTFAFLTIAFLAFSFSVYLGPAMDTPLPPEEAGPAANGRLVWQKYNCQSCHQLYGLGGYLGPDLTNVYSASGKGEPYIRAFLEAGVSSMPVFDLTEEETLQLIAFLKATDSSGSASPADFIILPTGMTKRK